MQTNDNEFSTYISNEEMCKLQGIPCQYGIPCCSECFQPDMANKNNEGNMRLEINDVKKGSNIL